jgi:hypothetical protein
MCTPIGVHLYILSSVHRHVIGEFFLSAYFPFLEPGYLSGIALGYVLDDRGFESWLGLGIFLYTTASRPALGPTQPPIQWIPGALSLGVKRPGREADHSSQSSAEVKNAWRYTSTPQYAIMAWCSVKAQGQLYLYFPLCVPPLKLFNQFTGIHETFYEHCTTGGHTIQEYFNFLQSVTTTWRTHELVRWEQP